jgi:hypothetical protein
MLIRQKLVLSHLLLILIVLLSSCNCHINDEAAATNTNYIQSSDSLTLISEDIYSLEKVNSLTPLGCEIKKMIFHDLINDSLNEMVVHYSTEDAIPCSMIFDSICYSDRVVVYEQIKGNWYRLFANNINNPLFTDSVNEQEISMDSLGILTISCWASPTRYSSIHCIQSYYLEQDVWLLKSVSQQFGNREGFDMYLWDYQLDVGAKTCAMIFNETLRITDEEEDTRTDIKECNS